MCKFIMLNNKTVYNRNNGDDTLIKNFGDKIVYTLCYLYGSTNNFGKTLFTIEELISFCGIKVNTHKGKSVDNFKELLINLQKNKIITNVDTDINKVSIKDIIRCELNIQIDKNENGDNTEFFNIDMDNLLKILETKTSNKKYNLLNVYAYICARVYKGTNDISKDGGKAHDFHGDYKCFTDDLNISKPTLDKCLKELKELQLIDYGNIGMVTNSKGSKMANNVYVLNASDLESALQQSKDYFKSAGYSIKKTDNKTSNKIKGVKGAIARGKKEGRDTTELENKLNKLENKLKNKLDGEDKNEIIKDIKKKYSVADKMWDDDTMKDIEFGATLDYYVPFGKDKLSDCTIEELQNIVVKLDDVLRKMADIRIDKTFNK